MIQVWQQEWFLDPEGRMHTVNRERRVDSPEQLHPDLPVQCRLTPRGRTRLTRLAASQSLDPKTTSHSPAHARRLLIRPVLRHIF